MAPEGRRRLDRLRRAHTPHLLALPQVGVEHLGEAEHCCQSCPE